MHIRPRFLLVIVGLVAILVTEALTHYYRPWIYRNHYFDMYIADTAGSLGGTVAAVFLASGVFGENQKNAVPNSIGIVIGCLIYEALQPFFHTGVFDFADLVAVAVSGGLSIWAIKLVFSKDSSGDDVVATVGEKT